VHIRRCPPSVPSSIVPLRLSSAATSTPTARQEFGGGSASLRRGRQMARPRAQDTTLEQFGRWYVAAMGKIGARSARWMQIASFSPWAIFAILRRKDVRLPFRAAFHTSNGDRGTMEGASVGRFFCRASSGDEAPRALSRALWLPPAYSLRCRAAPLTKMIMICGFVEQQEGKEQTNE
jgi:hypothetical protein